MSHKLSLPAIEVRQPALGEKKAIYCATIQISDLIDETAFKVDFWEKEKEGKNAQGYQRNMNELHVKKIADFLSDKDALLPTSILISTREYMPEFKNNTLIIDNFPLFIVDGQHRVEGLRDAIQNKKIASWEKATLPVIILAGFKKFEEMVQFVDLNTKQKKVATDLALELMLEMSQDSKWREKFRSEGADWKPRAIKLVNELNRRENSPWHQQIKMPGESAKSGNFRTTANSFATSLKPLLSGMWDRDTDIETCLGSLCNYWFILHEIFPDAFLRPREYAIQKTPGLFPLHKLLLAMLYKRGSDFGLKKAEMKPLLKKIFTEAEIDSDFWRSDNRTGVTMYGSMKGFGLLSDRFSEAYKTVIKE